MMTLIKALPIVGPITVLIWSGYKTRRLKRELLDIYTEQNISPPSMEWEPFKNPWSVFHIRPGDPDVIKIKKQQLLSKVGEHSFAAGLLFIISFVCLAILVVLIEAIS